MLWLSLSIGLLIFSHLIKVFRWELLTNPYEKTEYEKLLKALSIGYAVNLFIPFRIGELVRAYIASRKTRTGLIFYFSTIVIDRLLDIICVFIFLVIFAGLHINTNFFYYEVYVHTAFQYFFIIVLIISVILIMFALNKKTKQSINIFASVFNETLRLKSLMFAWSTISILKDLFYRINKLSLLLLSIIMWLGYLFSYVSFCNALTSLNLHVDFSQLFLSLFSLGNVAEPQLTAISSLANGNINVLLLTILFTVSPIIFIFIASFIHNQWLENFIGKFRKENFLMKDATINMVPFVTKQERLKFFVDYFSGEDREYYKTYVNINRNISILQDMSGGSHATTLKAIKDDDIIYRKYAFGSEGNKLRVQADWIKEQAATKLPLPETKDEFLSENVYYYDMKYDSDAKDFFTVIHSMDDENIWNILYTLLEDIDHLLHSKNKREHDSLLIQKYIKEKYLGNINTLKITPELSSILSYDTLIINGKEYKNLKYFESKIDENYLFKIFSQDECSDIHGDLTVENIIFSTNREKKYYLIDPNSLNIHNTPFIDYGKLLQSLHYGYEFLQKTSTVETYLNIINYPHLRSKAYDNLYHKYKQYLESKFNKYQIKSIYYHEIIHVLRLLPYKFKMVPDRALIYYAAFIVLLNDIYEDGYK
ncbi:hypothetical protein ASG89_10115 [Paenibacillus sp. Soil766]|uniref:lysylphosphatidylglycerol synthase transmembrane domain-containing protein n=1 Tax=Paenibacillus sp. Soil766 TaxID=1736404 RepID=UPI00070DA636|nr:lysylphosphatidylglycerol synthase transmembrane domain-containing protein [Paenibacillus sp. Soil766]KRE86363.1 hypothetical protein ASG89_10115 [Paenibacillus sp. Soil766]